MAFRNYIFALLNDYEHVDAAGRCMNNLNGWQVPAGEQAKLGSETIHQYVICASLSEQCTTAISRGRSQFSRSSTAYLSPQLRGDEIAPLHFDEPGRIQSMSAVVAGSSGDYGLSQSYWEGVFAREDPWNYDNA